MTANGFTRTALETEGFTGWITFKQVLEEDSVPRVGGVASQVPGEIARA